MRLLLFVFLLLCAGRNQAQYRPAVTDNSKSILEQRFPAPPGYERRDKIPGTFATYLRQLPLQPAGSRVHHFDGSLKQNTAAYCAVVRIDIGTKDLQQCADAVMRLRGEYLYATQQWPQLGFAFTADRKIHYFRQESAGLSYTAFRKWMDRVFAFANTRSLYNQLTSKNIQEIAPGDVLIQTGNPYGHAVIVVDMVVHQQSGHKLFMLAQSYMPAQEIQVLRNPNNPALSPWYSLPPAGSEIKTPEWVFTTADLRHF